MAQQFLHASTLHTFVGVLLSLLAISSARCPSRESSWCLQVDGFDTIILDGSKFSDIKNVFSKIKFLFEEDGETTELDQLLLINNHHLKKLERNAFGEFRFRRIVIKNCTNLAEVEPEAFNGTKQFVKQLKFDTVAVNDRSQEDFFEALNSLDHLEELEILNHKILKIRPYTFRQPQLAKLTLGGPIEVLEHSFIFYLQNLRILILTGSISTIQQHSFDLKHANNKSLDIYLNCKLGKLERGVFVNSNRPITINIYLAKLTHPTSFEAAVWKPILEAPMAHEIIFHGNPKEMHNPCQLLWLFRRKFRGVFTFKDEPLINEAYFDKWQCSYNTHSVEEAGDGELPEIEEINRAGIDATHNAAAAISLERSPPGMLLAFFFVDLLFFFTIHFGAPI